MKRKWLKWVILLGVTFFIIIPLGLLLIAWMFIDPIGRQVIQSGGTSALGVNTQLASFHCSVLTGSVAMNRLTIDDPQGFDASKKMFSMGEMATGVSIGSLTSDTIEIKELVIDDLSLYLEANAQTSNVQAILAHVNGDSTGAPSPTPAQPASTQPAQPAASGPEKRFKIALIQLKHISMDLHVTAPVELKKTLTIPPFEMRDLWKKDGTGFTAGELIVEILNRTTKAGLDVGGSDLQGLIKAQLTAALNKAGDKFKAAASAEASQAASQVKSDMSNEATKALQGAANGQKPADAAKDSGKTLEKDLGKLKNPFK